jgi:hypothetical protein
VVVVERERRLQALAQARERAGPEQLEPLHSKRLWAALAEVRLLAFAWRVAL